MRTERAMQTAITLALAVLLSCQTSPAGKEALSTSDNRGQLYELKYRYVQGYQYQYFTEIEERISTNSDLFYSGTLTNKISSNIIEVEKDRGRILSTIITTERMSAPGKRAIEKTIEYETVCWRDKYGKYEISKEAFMPVLRDMPVFPNRLLRQGESWSAPAEEVHDFRDMSIEDPVHVPFIANYKLERIEMDGRIAVIKVDYKINSNFSIENKPSIYPKRMSGRSRQLLRWNIALGVCHASEETFNFTLYFSNGQVVKYSGKAMTRKLE